MDETGVQRIPLQLSRNCVIASIQIDLTDEVLDQFRKDLLDRLQSSGAAGVILDLSGVEILDVEDFEALRRTMAMAAIMGARTVIVGLRPGVVSSLVELGADVDGVEAVLNLDDACHLMDTMKPGENVSPIEGREEMDERDLGSDKG